MLTGDTVAILSGGPSLLAHFARGDEFQAELDAYDVLVAVNHNAEKAEADWWVFSDPPVFNQTLAKGRPVIFGRRDWTRARFQPNPDPWAFWPKVFQDDCHDLIPRVTGGDESLPLYTGPKFANWRDPATGAVNLPRWNFCSGPAALGLVYLLKPKSVMLYGFDMAGEAGVNDGEHPGLAHNRGEPRWQHERRVFAWWMEEYAKAGIQTARA